jgi:hypothetical protein
LFAALAINASNALAALGSGDLERIARYETGRGSHNEARQEFANRGPEIAEHFLKHTGPPGNSAYFFALEAVGDAKTALVLISALVEPPKVESGPVLSAGGRSWFHQRESAEIRVAIEATLASEEVNRNEEVINALVVAARTLSANRVKVGEAGMAIELLGKCRGAKAEEALREFARNSEPMFRTLAVQALGEMGAGKAEAASSLETLARTLRTDANVQARIEAATALGKTGSQDAVQPLKEALAQEASPQVVDAIVLALRQLSASITDPQVCLATAARAWEIHAAKPLFDCWRVSATRDEILAAAVASGAPIIRALALYSLVERPRSREAEPLLRFRPDNRSRFAVEAYGRPYSAGTESGPVQFDTATRDHLLVSAIEVLSKKGGSLPERGNEISSSTLQMTRDALWEISGRSMPVALEYADRIENSYAFSRYWTSNDLANKDGEAYFDYRRPRQALLGVMLALICAPFVLAHRVAALLLVIAALGWAVSSLFMDVVRELPPPYLQFQTVTFIAFLSAGIASGATATLKPPSGVAKGMGRFGLTIFLAAALGFALCAISRWGDHFPKTSEGWELIFDPIGSALLSALISAGLIIVGVGVPMLRPRA